MNDPSPQAALTLIIVFVFVIPLTEMIVSRVLAVRDEIIETSLSPERVLQAVALRQVRWVRTDEGEGNLLNLRLRSQLRYIIAVNYDEDDHGGLALVTIGLSAWVSRFGLFASRNGFAPFLGWNIWLLKRKLANHVRAADEVDRRFSSSQHGSHGYTPVSLPESEPAIDPEQVAPAHREVIGAIANALNPIFYDQTDSEELKPLVPKITELCVQLVQEDPSLIQFVRDLRDMAIRGALADFAVNDKALKDQGWNHLQEALDAAFPDVDLVKRD